MTVDRGEPPRVWVHSQWGGMMCWRNYPAERSDSGGGRRWSFSHVLCNPVGRMRVRNDGGENLWISHDELHWNFLVLLSEFVDNKSVSGHNRAVCAPAVPLLHYSRVMVFIFIYYLFVYLAVELVCLCFLGTSINLLLLIQRRVTGAEA